MREIEKLFDEGAFTLEWNGLIGPASQSLTTPYSPPWLPAHLGWASMSSAQSKPGPTPSQSGFVIPAVGVLPSSRRCKCRTSERVNGYISLNREVLFPKEPTPPEFNGELFLLVPRGLMFRMLHVWMCNIRLRSLRNFSLGLQTAGRFFSNPVKIYMGV